MKKVGDIRTFEKHNGDWKIKQVNLTNFMLTLTLENIICPNCKYKISKPRNYTFNYVEELENKGNKKYLGISKCGRYILLDDYVDKAEIEKKLEGK